MNQIVNAEELVSAVPLDKPEVKKMTRREKLLHLASLVAKRGHVRIYHGLEHYDARMLKAAIDWRSHEGYETGGLFGIAVSDPVLREQGLVGTKYDETRYSVSAQEIMDTFELTQAELHEFSCDCGGAMSGRQIAGRIERLAKTGPAGVTIQAAPVIDSSSWTGRIRKAVGL